MALSPTPTHGTAAEVATPHRLSTDRCRTVLREATHGYLALSRGALPIVVPVSCALDGDSLLVRAGPGSLDQATAQPGVVAFGTIIPSVDGTCRWEVLVQGRAELVCSPASDFPPRLALTNPASTTVFRLTLELLTGWEHRPAL
jgi:Pyridoxamine 5'-phosphate oxidase